MLTGYQKVATALAFVGALGLGKATLGATSPAGIVGVKATSASVLGARVGQDLTSLHLRRAWDAQTAGQNSWIPIAGRYKTEDEALELAVSDMGWVRSQVSFFAQMLAVLKDQIRYIIEKDEERESQGSGFRKPDRVSAADFVGEDASKEAEEGGLDLYDGLATRKANVSPHVLRNDPTVSREQLEHVVADYNLGVSIDENY